MDIDIRDLQTRLSEVLDRLAEGEVIRVIDRGKPKAILAPVTGPAQFERGGRDGWSRPGNGEPPRPAQRQRARRSIAEVLREDRGP